MKLIKELLNREKDFINHLEKQSKADELDLQMLEEIKSTLKLINNYNKKHSHFSEKDLIESAKYGYEYHAKTKFPDKSFKDNCKNNFAQHLLAKYK